jgi:hypothetical protein
VAKNSAFRSAPAASWARIDSILCSSSSARVRRRTGVGVGLPEARSNELLGSMAMSLPSSIMISIAPRIGEFVE